MTQNLNIISGADKDFTILISTSGGPNDGEPFDLTGTDKIIALFQNTDETVLKLTLSSGIVILSETTGKIKVTLLDTQTALMATGEGQSFEIELHTGTNIQIIQFIGILNVTARIFPQEEN